MARELGDGSENVAVQLASRLQSKPRLFQGLDGLDDEVHAVGLIAGSGGGRRRAHFRPGEGCEVAALHRRAVAGGLAAGRRTGSCAGRSAAAGVLPHFGIVVGYVCHRRLTRRPPRSLGAILAGRSSPLDCGLPKGVGLGMARKLDLQCLVCPAPPALRRLPPAPPMPRTPFISSSVFSSFACAACAFWRCFSRAKSISAPGGWSMWIKSSLSIAPALASAIATWRLSSAKAGDAE